MSSRLHRTSGFTLVEMVIVIVVIGILVAVALNTGQHVFESARTEETKQELDALAEAIVGNAAFENVGSRAEFGYVGDVGAFPPNLDALATNPGSYSTWNGPYVSDRFAQIAGDYKADAWGSNYSYAGLTITSTGSGSNIVRRLGSSISDFTLNTVSGVVLDLDATPPGSDYRDSLDIRLTHPNGTGGIRVQSSATDGGGYFEFDSVPVGSHDLDIIYLPTADTISTFVTVLPSSRANSQYHLAANVWQDTSSGGGTALPAPLAHWKFDESSGITASDASGSGHDGTLIYMNPATDWVTGQIDGALDFDGSNDYVQVPSAPALQLTSALTIAGWIKADFWGSGSDVDPILRKGGSTPVNYQLAVANGLPAMMLDNMDGSGGFRGSTLLNTGQWYHIAGTWDGSVVKLYVNGVLDNSPGDARSGTIGTDTRPLYMGGRTSEDRLNGQLDDVRLYDRALTEAEILQLYNGS